MICGQHGAHFVRAVGVIRNVEALAVRLFDEMVLRQKPVRNDGIDVANPVICQRAAIDQPADNGLANAGRLIVIEKVRVETGLRRNDLRNVTAGFDVDAGHRELPALRVSSRAGVPGGMDTRLLFALGGEHEWGWEWVTLRPFPYVTCGKPLAPSYRASQRRQRRHE